MNQIIFIVAKPNYIRVILYDIQNKFNNWVYKNVYLAYIISVCTLRVQMYMLILLLRNASKLEICIEVGELEPQEACGPPQRERERESRRTTYANRMQLYRGTFSVALATKLISFSDDFLH